MLRFNLNSVTKRYRINNISIHPMLRFNGGCLYGDAVFIDTFQYILCYGSTKVMELKGHSSYRFQYILCYGSTFMIIQSHHSRKYFNTSYVTVQLHRFSYCGCYEGFQYILCYGSTFYATNLNVASRVFQYILCYGSTCISSSSITVLDYFNTSYVTVQPWLEVYFLQNKSKFQYILCYGSTSSSSFQFSALSGFQYILCYGSTTQFLHCGGTPTLFQYILCYGST